MAETETATDVDIDEMVVRTAHQMCKAILNPDSIIVPQGTEGSARRGIAACWEQERHARLMLEVVRAAVPPVVSVSMARVADTDWGWTVQCTCYCFDTIEGALRDFGKHVDNDSAAAGEFNVFLPPSSHATFVDRATREYPRLAITSRPTERGTLVVQFQTRARI